ncbi:hypothetical protein [Synechococcus sp. A15-127]|uniref:hypothetical protein n=1 Tax=Synechococcus sp. A15-127 TaxID=1050624 RepID=UPI002105059B|nr:hypothetical protein [Synechococcus sp. A15-127]
MLLHLLPMACCERCSSNGSLHYRVSTTARPEWHFVCPGCWPTTSLEEGYRYGGTRKRSGRRRQRRPQQATTG